MATRFLVEIKSSNEIADVKLFDTNFIIYDRIEDVARLFGKETDFLLYMIRTYGYIEHGSACCQVIEERLNPNRGFPFIQERFVRPRNKR